MNRYCEMYKAFVDHVLVLSFLYIYKQYILWKGNNGVNVPLDFNKVCMVDQTILQI